MLGIDVSENNSIVEWQAAVDAEAKFCIVRAGYGQGHEDSRFREYVAAAHDAGMQQVGAYWFSYALNADEAASEGELCRQIIDNIGCTLELPVFFDQEDSKWRKENNCDYVSLTAQCDAFASALGPNCGIYANYSWFTSYLDYEALKEKYPIWLAEYSANCDLECTIWQYSEQGSIGGYTTDLNTMGE